MSLFKIQLYLSCFLKGHWKKAKVIYTGNTTHVKSVILGQGKYLLPHRRAMLTLYSFKSVKVGNRVMINKCH